MVSKKSSDLKQNVSEGKTVKNTAAQKKNAPKAKAAKTVTSEKKKVVPETQNVNVVEEVLNVKSRNIAKKTEKDSLTVSAKDSEEAMAKAPKNAEKGNKPALANAKRASVKENAKIAKAKKFAEMKEHPSEDITNEDSCAQNCCCGAWHSWVNAYKNIFNFKGRTSRFEFWSFMLINLFMFMIVGGILAFIPNTVVYLVLSLILCIAEIFVYLSIFTRRLHDAGYSAWKGFFKPLVFSWFFTLLIWFGAVFCQDAYPENTGTLLTLYSFVIFAMLMYIYYTIKIFIAAGFFEEEHNANVYGAASFIDDAHKNKSLIYASLYILSMFILYLSTVVTAFYSILMGMFMSAGY